MRKARKRISRLDLELVRENRYNCMTTFFAKMVFLSRKRKGNNSEHIMVRLMLQALLRWKRPELYLDQMTY